jgi:hypothetical protein
MINFLLNIFKKDKNVRCQTSNIFIDNENILYKQMKYDKDIIINNYIYYTPDIKINLDFNQIFGYQVYYKKIDNVYHFVYPYEFIFYLNKWTEYKEVFYDMICKNDLYNIFYKYLNDLENLNTLVHIYDIKHSIKHLYDDTIVNDNKLIIKDTHIKTEKFLYGKKMMMYLLPEHLRDDVISIEFVINSNFEIIECFVTTKTTSHPNINFRNNKYCLGNYRFKKLNKENVISIIENIKIYNLFNYYDIPETLKKYIKHNIDNNFNENINFFN